MVTQFMETMPEKTYINYEGRDFVEIEKGILHEAENALVFCVGNIHGRVVE